MADQGDGDGKLTTPTEGMDEAWTTLLERSQKVGKLYQERLKEDDGFSVTNSTLVGQVFLQIAQFLYTNPAKMHEAQTKLASDYARLVEAIDAATKGLPNQPVAEAGPGDRRFKDPEWEQNPAFSAIKQYYLLTSRWLEGLVDSIDGLDPKSRQKAQFYTRQFISAMAPTNFIATNPKVIREIQKTKGESLRKGLTNMLDDVERGRGQLQISLTDFDAFTLGENIAATPGRVIYQNDLMQLIQYTPATATVRRRPLLIVPPWINKFYVLDLQPKNSFIKWAVDQGHTVFVISWVNPGESLTHKTFDDYVLEGPIAALDAIEKATGEPEVNAIGYCIGGTLLAITLAHMAVKGDTRVASATFFTTMVDFADPGELGVFIDEDQIDLVEKHMQKKGYMDGAQMAQVFSMLRENDLIWSAFESNYMLGKDPRPFDLLYWNSDSTRMPVMMHSFYLREMYLNNRLIEPDALTVAGTPIDLRRIKQPVYILSTREDHIAPWTSTYSATQIYSGPVKFVLAGSGHIAGVINPPAANKYEYWTHTRKVKSPDAFLKAAKSTEGSWWPHWDAWVGKHGGGQVSARVPGEGKLNAIELAPGSYVRMRATD